MAVIRVNKSRDYTVMSNAHFKEKEMTLKAKGLLSLMLSLPDEWDYSIAGLAALSKDGKDSVMNALTELESFGYLERVKLTNEKGQFAGYEYNVFESPRTENPNEEKPYPENPNTDKPNSENPPQLNTNTLNTKKSNTKKSNNIFVPPTVEEVKAYCTERNNNINPEHFVDYYESKGWMVGRTKMKDWKAAVRNWERNSFNKPNNQNQQQTQQNGQQVRFTTQYDI